MSTSKFKIINLDEEKKADDDQKKAEDKILYCKYCRNRIDEVSVFCRHCGRQFLQNTPSGFANGHEWVDLGLSVRWAKCNTGALSPSEHGHLDRYDLITRWGGGWRLPTKEEMTELVKKCELRLFKWENGSPKNGYGFIGPNGNKIFLPAAGYYGLYDCINAGSDGYYWASDGSGRGLLLFHVNSKYGYPKAIAFPSNNNRCSTRLVITIPPSEQKKEMCIYCGKKIDDDSVFCAYCGRQLRQYSPQSGYVNGHECVDLGIGAKWATCNVGAMSPGDYGNYYAWGETEAKLTYSPDTSDTFGHAINDIAGDGWYDVAKANFGKGWRMPTKVEFVELKKRCKWTWATQGGHSGYKVIGPTGNSIFLPLAGYRFGETTYEAGEQGHYWCSTPLGGSSEFAYRLRFGGLLVHIGTEGRQYGLTIRPVSDY